MEEVRKRNDITIEEFIERVRGKIREMGGLLTEEGAALLVAKELGIEAVKPVLRTARVKIEDLVEGLSKVKIVCRVIDVDPPLVFKREDRELKLAKIKVADDSGVISVTLWPPHVRLVEDLQLELGDVIGIENARSTRFRRRLELSLGEKGAIIANPQHTDLPSISDLLKEELRTLELTVTSVKDTIQIETRWGIRSVSCIEGVGNKDSLIRLVLWGRKANWAKYIKAGDIVRIKAILNIRKEFEVGGRKFIEYSTGSNTSFKKIGETPVENVEKTFSIDEIEIDKLGFSTNVRGTLSAFLMDRGFRTLLCGLKSAAWIAVPHDTVRLALLQSSDKICRIELKISDLEPLLRGDCLFESTLWSKCTPLSDSNIFDTPEEVESFEDISPGSPVRIKARMADVDVVLNYYCSYCGKMIGSPAHRCFEERMLSVVPVVTLKLVLDDGSTRIEGLSSDITLLEDLTKIGTEDILEYFIEGEGIEPVLRYQLELLRGEESVFLCRSFNIKTTLDEKVVIVGGR